MVIRQARGQCPGRSVLPGVKGQDNDGKGDTKQMEEQGTTEQAGRASRGRWVDGTGERSRAGRAAGQDTAGRAIRINKRQQIPRY